MTVTDAWAAQRSLVVLGDPGAGKTTLLRWLAVVCSRGPVGVREALGSWERLVAVPVSVGRLADVRRALGEGPVTAALGRYFADRNVHDDPAAIGAFLARELEAGSCLVLLDGLDEVRQDERDAVVRWLETFAARYPANRFVVTSRVVGYAGFSLHGAAELVVAPLSDAQIERFVRVFTREYEAWALGVRDDRGADERAADLLAALGTGTGLRQLAANPFLLASLALIHRAEGRLPRHRVQAYEVFARALCETWGSARRLVAKERHEPDLPYEEEALPALGHLALRMHARFPSGVAPEAWVLDTLSDWLRAERGVAEPRAAARAFLDKAGRDVQILYERGHGEWGFSHLTFQEFFAAAGLHAAERYEDFLFRHLFEPRWREVLRLGMGYLALVQKRPKKAAELVQKVLEWEQPQPHQWLTSELWLNAVYAAIFDGECGDSIPNVLHAEIVARMMLLRLSGNFLTPPALEAVLTALGESAGLPEPDVDVAIERIREAVRGHNEERGGRRRPTTDPFDVSHGFRVLISLAAEIPAFRTELGDNFTKTPTGMATLTDDASLAELRTLASRGVKDASWALAWRGYPEAWPALSDLPTLDRLVALGRMYEAGRWIPAADDID